jgi:hypothetical protein
MRYLKYDFITPDKNAAERAIKDYWSNGKINPPKRGRPRITKEIRELIKKIKIGNYLWGCKRIQDELEKLSIDISRETIRKVIQDYRKSGDINPNYSWNRFLKSHWKSLFACDFFTVDIFGIKRFYVFFIMELKSRKIVHYKITQSPNKRSVRKKYTQSLLQRDYYYR